jgi:uncharacterized protein (TIGR02145 family)
MTEIRIGEQVWMAENLSVEKFRNGDTIFNASSREKWQESSQLKQPACCVTDTGYYGCLYNWHAVNDPRGIAPRGWHVATDEEWTQLIEYLGDDRICGIKMKSVSGWKSSSVHGYATNESAFKALPGGYRFVTGHIFDILELGYWWSSTEKDKNEALSIRLSYVYRGVIRENQYKGFGLSVRCIRD